MANYAVLVDPLSSGRYLPDEFRSRGIKCIAVLSGPVPDEFKCGYSPDKFEETIQFDGNLNALVQRLKEYSPVCVMLGLETGIELADALAAQLDLPGNDPASSRTRRDKFEMHAALKAAGVRSVSQKRVTSAAVARDWIESHNVWPVVVKPIDSAGSENVYICRTVEQVLGAVHQVLGATNMFGRENESAVLQEYLDGREWVVDTVSCNGKHAVTNVSRYLKTVMQDGSIVYRSSEFLCPSNPEYAELIAYALSVNDALGVRYGAAHLEIIITAQGPTLVEINARMHGCDAIKALQWCYPVTQLDLSVDAFIAPEAFASKTQEKFKNPKYMLAHYLIAGNAGMVTKVIDVESLKNISSYKLHCLPSKGKVVKKTVSLLSSPGNIWLVNDDYDGLQADEQYLIDMENRGDLLVVTDK